MALTNYILTSLVCQCSSCGAVGTLREAYLSSASLRDSCVWVLNIAVSLLWLRSFQFGPLEWVWRSLTYWKLQPIRRYRSSLAGSLF